MESSTYMVPHIHLNNLLLADIRWFLFVSLQWA